MGSATTAKPKKPNPIIGGGLIVVVAIFRRERVDVRRTRFLFYQDAKRAGRYQRDTFHGKAKVEKAHSMKSGPTAVNHWVYFINHDWNLPIGYVWLAPDSIKGMNFPDFYVAFWSAASPTVSIHTSFTRAKRSEEYRLMEP
jgi:hypothetical protein